MPKWIIIAVLVLLILYYTEEYNWPNVKTNMKFF